MLKLERKFLHEVPAELSGLLEPVSDPEARLRLLSKKYITVKNLNHSAIGDLMQHVNGNIYIKEVGQTLI